MRVIFTRHGETRENSAGITQGQGVAGQLSEAGIVQTQRLAQRLRHERFQYVYVSDLARAVHTAQEVIRFHPQAQLIKTPSLRERNLGMYEGKPAEIWKKDMAKSPVPFHSFKPDQGDSYEELQMRMKTFWKQLLDQHPNDSLLLISHGGALTMLFLYLFGRPLTSEEYKRHKPQNTAVTICEFSIEGECITHVFNSTEHLEAEHISQQ